MISKFHEKSKEDELIFDGVTVINGRERGLGGGCNYSNSCSGFVCAKKLINVYKQ